MKALKILSLLLVFASCNEVPEYETLKYVGKYRMDDLSISYNGIDFGQYIDWPEQMFGTIVNINSDYTYSYDSTSRFFSFIMGTSSIADTELFGVYYLKDQANRTNAENILYMPLNDNVIFVERNGSNAVFSFQSYDQFENKRDYMFFRYCGYKFGIEITERLNVSKNLTEAAIAGYRIGFYEGYRDRYTFLESQRPTSSIDPLRIYSQTVGFVFKQNFTNSDPVFLNTFNTERALGRNAGTKLADTFFTETDKSLSFNFYFTVN